MKKRFLGGDASVKHEWTPRRSPIIFDTCLEKNMSWLRIPDPSTSAGRQAVDLLLVGASFALVSSISDAVRYTVYGISGWDESSILGAWIHVVILLLATFALAYFFYFTGIRRPANKQTVQRSGPGIARGRPPRHVGTSHGAKGSIASSGDP